MCRIAYLNTTSAIADRLVDAFATADDAAQASVRLLPQRRRQSLAVRALLRAMLAQASRGTRWQLHRRSDGAPFVTADGAATPSVSLSHSGDMVACAVDWTARIGLDVEQRRLDRPIRELAAAFGPTEAAAVDRRGAPAFYRIWTAREALAKASGGAFALVVDGIDHVPITAARRRTGPGGDQGWSFFHWVRSGYALSLVREAAGGDPSMVRIQPAGRIVAGLGI